MTPLSIAAFWGYADIVEYLLDIGAEINKCNTGNNWTPLHCAAFQGHGKVIMYLMKHGPDLYIKDKLGRTPVDFASALDSVWSFFEVSGCKRTPKSELIKLDIVKKVSQYDSTITQSPSERVHFSRPGSAYIIKTQTTFQDHNMVTAAMTGDVLAGIPEDNFTPPSYQYQPGLSVLNN
ncbi:hypothetical protein LOTGIDRAFT_203408 [Lottia gigantea]|uniref:Uncharacterized protein n=1 Tax=Lottia gigantea TaxID=225164 RepID=V4B9D8_LOTGI|nr:hypothetical protein LOTGIDRAFT_203408 [Lottia gigantea]ESP03986.1 hypothetical protein LOTGIDRAFT_203408 [Lottia gigantea]